jgi:hypothetical protein
MHLEARRDITAPFFTSICGSKVVAVKAVSSPFVNVWELQGKPFDFAIFFSSSRSAVESRRVMRMYQ